MQKKSSNTFTHSVKANADTLKLLTLHPLFLTLVKEMRKQFDIPEEGFFEPDNEKVHQWYQQVLYVGSDNYMESWGFKNELKEIYSAWERQEIDYQEREARNARANAKVPINAWQIALLGLTKKFCLPENFQESIECFVTCNQLRIPSNFSVQTKPHESSVVAIKIYGPIRDQDRKHVFQMAERIARRQNPKAWKRYKPLNNIDRDMRVLTLTAEKVAKSVDSGIHSDVDIAANIFADEDIPLEKLGAFDRKKARHIATVRKRIRKALRERFPDDTFAS